MKIPFRNRQDIGIVLQELGGMVSRFFDKRAGERVPFVMVIGVGKVARFVSNIRDAERIQLLRATLDQPQPQVMEESTQQQAAVSRTVAPVVLDPIYPPISHEALGPHYLRHVDHMTREGLHAKSDIAAQLAYRDKVIEELRERLGQLATKPMALLNPINLQPTLKIGGRYNWIGQDERLIYRGPMLDGTGWWHQFALIDKPDKIWCEVRADELSRFEESKP